jgi:hypothetical protein
MQFPVTILDGVAIFEVHVSGSPATCYMPSVITETLLHTPLVQRSHSPWIAMSIDTTVEQKPDDFCLIRWYSGFLILSF